MNYIYNIFKKQPVLIIIALALLLRLYHVFDWFFWNVDEDILGLTAKRIVIDHRPQLLGFPIPGGIYIGPLIYYLISLAYFFSRMNPFGLSVFAAFIGTAVTYLVYLTGKTLFSHSTVGLIAAVVYAFSSLVNVYTRIFTALTFAPILALLIYLILYDILVSKKPQKILLLSFLLAFSTQNEGSSLSLIALTLLMLILYRIKIGWKNAFVILTTVLLFQIPLFIFDLRHDFFVFKSLLNFFQKFSLIGESGSGFKLPIQSLSLFPQTFTRFLFISGDKDITSQILPCSDLILHRLSQISLPVFLISTIILIFFIAAQFKKNQPMSGQKIIFFHLSIGTFGVMIYNLFFPGYTHEWILNIFFPAFALITAWFLNTLLKKGMYFKILAVFCFGLFIVFNVFWLTRAGNKFGLLAKFRAVQYAVSEIKEQSFALDSLGSCHAQGYIYLFYYLGHLPAKSYADDMFSSTIFSTPQPDPNLKVVMVNPSAAENEQFWQKYFTYKSQAIKSKGANEIEVMIMDN